MQTSTFSTLQQIAEGIRSKAFSPVEIIDAHLKRIDSTSQSSAPSSIWTRTSPHPSLRRAILYLRGDPVGPLHGVPLTIKSCIDVAGWPALPVLFYASATIPNATPLSLRD